MTERFSRDLGKKMFEWLVFNPEKPVRRTIRVHATFDQDGNPVTIPIEQEAFSLSPEGSIDRIIVSQDRFYHCGCGTDNKIGGQCAEPSCRHVSCAKCFGRCERCKKPLCLEHSCYFELPELAELRFCHSCRDELGSFFFRSELIGYLTRYGRKDDSTRQLPAK